MIKRLAQAALIFGAIILIVGVESSAIPTQGQICKENNEDCTTHNMALVVLWQTAEAFEEHGEAVIALFTVILGISTWLLWQSTRDLVNGAEDTARRQLRAYVFVEPGDFDGLNPQTAAVGYFNVRNSGLTPAINVGYTVGFAVLDAPPTSIDGVNIGMVDKRGEENIGRPILVVPSSVINPGTSNPGKIIWHIRADNIAKINHGQLKIYLMGRIEYHDVFGDNRITDFCHVYWGVTTGKDRVTYYGPHTRQT